MQLFLANINQNKMRIKNSVAQRQFIQFSIFTLHNK